MKAKKRATKSKAKNKRGKRAIKTARSRAPKRTVTASRKPIKARRQKASVGTPEPAVAVYEVIETEVYTEPTVEFEEKQ